MKIHSCIIDRHVQGNSEEAKFNGIVNFFNNIPRHSFQEFISASTDAKHPDWGPPSTLIDYSIEGTSEQDQFTTDKTIPYPNITFQFKYPIYVTNYTLRTRTKEPDEHNPTSWKLDISSDGSNYISIDEEKSVTSLSGLNTSIIFKCDNPSKGKYLRLTMTDKSSSSINNKDERLWWFHLSRVEFFGNIYLNEGDLNCPVHSRFSKCPLSIALDIIIIAIKR